MNERIRAAEAAYEKAWATYERAGWVEKVTPEEMTRRRRAYEWAWAKLEAARQGGNMVTLLVSGPPGTMYGRPEWMEVCFAEQYRLRKAYWEGEGYTVEVLFASGKETNETENA